MNCNNNSCDTAVTKCVHIFVWHIWRKYGTRPWTRKCEILKYIRRYVCVSFCVRLQLYMHYKLCASPVTIARNSMLLEKSISMRFKHMKHSLPYLTVTLEIVCTSNDRLYSIFSTVSIDYNIDVYNQLYSCRKQLDKLLSCIVSNGNYAIVYYNEQLVIN